MKSFNDSTAYKDLSVFECGKEECIKSKVIYLTKKDYHLFHYVTNGKGTIIINQKSYSLSRGMIFFIPRQTDAIYFPDKDNPWSYSWVGFDGEKVDEYLEFLNVSISNPIIEDKNRTYRRHFDELISRYTMNGFIDIFAIGALYELFGELISDSKSSKALNRSFVTIQLAKDYIHNNYQFNITVDNVAQNANVTPNYLSALFKKEEGMSTKTYLTKVRMEKAMSLLKK